jgi:hypothetical protein
MMNLKGFERKRCDLIEVISRKLSEGTKNIRIYGVQAEMRTQNFPHINVTPGRPVTQSFHSDGEASYGTGPITSYSLVGRYITTSRRYILPTFTLKIVVLCCPKHWCPPRRVHFTPLATARKYEVDYHADI